MASVTGKRRSPLPNLITGARIVGTLWLLGLSPLSPWFYLVYTLTGLSDLLDGLVARKTQSATAFGAAFDSAADFFFCAVLFGKLGPLLWEKLPPILWGLAGAVLLTRLLSLGVAFRSRRRILALHTWLNKLTGGLLFLLPYFLNHALLVPGCFAAAILAETAALEELAIRLLRHPDSADIPTIFHPTQTSDTENN